VDKKAGTMTMEKQSILIVDDERMNIDILSHEFCRDYQILVAKDSKNVFKRLESQPVDLILLDVMLPGSDGFEIIRHLKEHESTKDIPVIFITARDKPEDEATGFLLGAVDYIRKPFNIPVVRARVKTQLDLRWKTRLLEQLVSMDGLTGISNRRRVEDVIQGEWKRAIRSGTPLAFMLLDIDFFKLLNDHYGHQAGDTCLRRVAQTIKHTLQRQEDFVGRYGGEEFIVILPNTQEEGAFHVAETIRKAVTERQIPHPKSPISEYVTITIGVSVTLPQEGISSSQLLMQFADQALYEGKQNGRNRVVTRLL
jgi:diguanylate cyclase (GGDEF)-like protein